MLKVGLQLLCKVTNKLATCDASGNFLPLCFNTEAYEY
jgi:hypothetical protein